MEFFDPSDTDLALCAQNASEKLSKVLEAPTELNEGILDRLIREEREVTDLKLVWGEVRPMGAERLFDLADLFVTLDGPIRGPTGDELKIFRKHLAKGDRLSMSWSRPTQWVVTTNRGKKIVCWGIEQEPGAEENPDAPVFEHKDGWAMWDLTEASHLRREGKVLGHCVGNSGVGYWEAVQAKKIKIYSVRHEGKSVCTVEVTREKKVVQTQGKSGRNIQNIGGDALDTFEAFAKQEGWAVGR